MADDVTLSGTGATPPANTKIVTDEHASRGHMQVIKLAYSADGDATLVGADGFGLDVDVTRISGTVPVSDGGGSITVDGTLDARLKTPNGDSVVDDTLDAVKAVIQDGGGSITVDGSVTATVQDGGGSITVDGSVTATVQDGGGSITVDDGGGSITVDGTIAVQGTQNNTTCTGYDVTTSATQALAANGSRRGLLLQNISDTRVLVRFNTNPVATGGSEVGFSIEAGGGSVSWHTNVDTRSLNVIHAGTGNKRLLITEW